MIIFILLFICVTLDAFIYMMEKGATTRNMNLQFALKHSAIFAFINTAVYLTANRFSATIFSIPFLFEFHQRISLVVLVGIGILLLVKTAKRKNFEEKLDLEFNSKTSVKKALITSIDTLLVGVYSAFLPTSIYLQAFSALSITFIMVYSALRIGYTHGAAYQKIIGYGAAAAYLLMAALQALQIYSLI